MPEMKGKRAPDDSSAIKATKPGIQEEDPLRSGPAARRRRDRPAPKLLIEELAAAIREVQKLLGRDMDIQTSDLGWLIESSNRLNSLIDTTPGPIRTGLSPVLDENLQVLRKELGHNDDLIIRRLHVGGKGNLRAALFYFDGMVERQTVHENILKPLMLFSEQLTRFEQAIPAALYLSIVKEYVVTVGEVREQRKLGDLIDLVLAGDTGLLLDGVPTAFLLGTRGWQSRAISEPAVESVIRGPRDGFVENMRTNVTHVRRRIRSKNLRVNVMKIGRRSKTDVAVLHIEGITNRQVVQEVFHRLQTVDVDAVLESGYIEQIIEDHHFSPFPQVQNTERPDKVAALLLEGRVALIVDGTPFALVVPSTFNQFYQSPEDYYERFLIGSLIRFIRLLALFFSLTTTALYVALISFHPEMIPTSFAIAIAGGRAGVPVPSVVEAMIMEITMEVLREASVRLPRPIGPTIGIVGALVIGEAATRAGLVSPLMVIVVAVTSIGSFAIPSYSAAIALRILKFPVIMAAGVFGLYGIMIALIAIAIHMASLESFGVPYLSPFAPLKLPDMKDAIVRFPIWRMAHRPEALHPQDIERLPQKDAASPRGGQHE